MSVETGVGVTEDVYIYIVYGRDDKRDTTFSDTRFLDRLHPPNCTAFPTSRMINRNSIQHKPITRTARQAFGRVAKTQEVGFFFFPRV